MRKNQETLEEIRRNAIEVDNYNFLDAYVREKKIVLLGESSHGVGDYFSEKIKIIKYLHEHHGFNIVVFENGLVESTISKERSSFEEPELVLQQHFMDIYHNEEMLPLFKDSWAHNLTITGMDLQPVYREASDYYVQTIKNKLDDGIYELLQNAENQYFELNELLLNTPKIKHLKPTIIACIQSYNELLDKVHLKDERQHIMLFNKFLENRIDWLNLNLKGLFSSGILRAQCMYKNVEWLLKFYRGEKLIIWAHNFHIRKSQTWVTKLLRLKNVGFSLQETMREDCFTIGLYASTGQYSSLYRNEFDIQLHNKHHLEKVCNEISKKSVFLPLIETKFGAQKWVLLESSMGSNLPKRMVPKKHYDAIICLKNVSLPTYLSRNNTLSNELVENKT